MKPHIIRQFLANSWFLGIAFLVITIGSGLLISMSIYNDKGGFLPAITGGAVGGVMISCIFFPFLGTILSKLNGAPFFKGDKVQIITGQHAGQIATVKEVWKDQKLLRVDLETQSINDNDTEAVYSFTNILRVKI